MPRLIPISDCYKNLTGDTLGSDKQFSVKIFFSKKLIFEISKIFFFLKPKIIKLLFLMAYEPFFYQTCEKSINNQMFDDF